MPSAIVYKMACFFSHVDNAPTHPRGSGAIKALRLKSFIVLHKKRRGSQKALHGAAAEVVEKARDKAYTHALTS